MWRLLDFLAVNQQAGPYMILDWKNGKLKVSDNTCGFIGIFSVES